MRPSRKNHCKTTRFWGRYYNTSHPRAPAGRADAALLYIAPARNTETAMNAAARQVDAEPVLLECIDQGVLRLTLNRPAARNALSIALMTALAEALAGAAENPACRVVVIAGAGRAFCAGHDLRELRSDPSRGAYQRV